MERTQEGIDRECLTKNQIFDIEVKLEKEWVSIPEWGENKGIYIKTMSGLERDDYQRSLFQKSSDGSLVPDSTNSTAKLVAACAINENGKLLFDFSDIKPLGNRSSLILERLAVVARERNGMGGEEVGKLLKNLFSTQEDDSD